MRLKIGALLAFGAISVPIPGIAQTMGATSSSTGTIVNPAGTFSIEKSFYGSKSLETINQSSRFLPPSYSYNLPNLPKPALPKSLSLTPKPYDPDLGSFELNRGSHSFLP